MSGKQFVTYGFGSQPYGTVPPVALDQAFNDATNYPSSVLAVGDTRVIRSLANKAADIVSVKDYGAVLDGITDDATAIQNALNSGANAVYMPSANARCSLGITVPGGVAFFGLGFLPGNPPFGAHLTFDLTVPQCITVGGPAANNKPSALSGIICDRAVGTPPVGSTGVYVQNTYPCIIVDVMSRSHAIPFYLKNDGNTLGLGCMIDRLFTAAATDSHVVVDTWTEARFNECRFGANGGGDYTCNSYIRVQGGSTVNAAGGPNTCAWVNCQFNQGVNLAGALIDFKSQVGGIVSAPTEWFFDTCHIEQCSNGIRSDATWASLQRLAISNCVFSAAVPFLSLNVATTFSDIGINNLQCFGSLAFAPTNQFNRLKISDSYFAQAVSITGVASSTLILADNNYGAGLTLAGAYAYLSVIGGAITGGALTDTSTATGSKKIDVGPNNGLIAFTPTLLIGGSAVGITYGLQVGGYQVFGNMVSGQFSITLTSKGVAAGVITIGGFPFPMSAASYGGAGGGLINYATGVGALNNGPMTMAITSGSAFNLYQQLATTVAAISDGNITNTTAIRGTFQYFM